MLTAGGPFGDPSENRQTLEPLLERYRRYLVELRPDWGPLQFHSLTRQAERGYLELRRWFSSEGSGSGLIFVQLRDGKLRVHGVWTEPATLRVFEALVSDLDTEANAPLEVVTDVIPGVDARIQASIWVPKGFWHRAKVRLRREPSAVLAPKRTTGEFRLIRPGDIEALVPVYAAAYSDRPGEFWTWDTPDAVGEAQAGLRRLVEESGAWAPGFYSEASYVCLRENTVCGAVLVDLGADGTPSFEDLIVAPGEQRTGLGRELMRRALNACRAGGDRAVELSAIRYGAPYRLYRELGFREVEGPRVVLDGHWVRGEDPTGGHGAE